MYQEKSKFSWKNIRSIYINIYKIHKAMDIYVEDVDKLSNQGLTRWN